MIAGDPGQGSQCFGAGEQAEGVVEGAALPAPSGSVICHDPHSQVAREQMEVDSATARATSAYQAAVAAADQSPTSLVQPAFGLASSLGEDFVFAERHGAALLPGGGAVGIIGVAGGATSLSLLSPVKSSESSRLATSTVPAVIYDVVSDPS